ncbi:ribosome small subunit-dependent GTPase A [Candidatus Poribacteria bacterium]|nr:MAG: ribosome small subunit-dependent GTPase A [Candidatus Poribacteria bacterium]
MAMPVYAGTTLIEAQKIVEGDYSAFDWRERVTYRKVYLDMSPAIRDAENALDNDKDKPVVVTLLLKSEKMLVKNRVRRLSAIKTARIISDEELLKRTGYLFDNEKLVGLPEGVVMRASNGVYIVQCDVNRYQCSLRGKRDAFSKNQQVYVGDRVKVQMIDERHGVIAAIMRRTSLYKRRGTQSKRVVLIPNLDGLIIVSSVKEPPIWQRMLDRFLVIAEASGIEPLVCFNKIDMLENRSEVDSMATLYEKIGYRAIITSATTGEGIEDLKGWLKGKISALSGLSGVGKSSLLNAVQPGLKLKTNKVNPRRGGRHTTVATQLYSLDFGGFIADTPGLRELHFWDIESHLMDRYFPEINSLRKRCMKDHCTHTREEGCAVKDALKTGGISKFRYQSYCEFQKSRN